MKLPAWLTGILFTAWTIWSTYDYYCNKCGCCSVAIPAALTTLPTSFSGAPTFKNGDAAAAQGTMFPAWKLKMLAEGGAGDTLTITGLYRASETNNTQHPNLGIARAAAIKALLAPELPDSRVKLVGKLLESELPTAEPYESAEFAWSKMVLKKDEGAIIESGNSATILFPFNSTSRDRDPKVDAFLQSLCTKYKAGTATFTIVGHTDDKGEAAANEALGLSRAMMVRQVLRDCGIARERIQASSKGEAEPVADNSTDEGRHQNRRVVITVNQ